MLVDDNPDDNFYHERVIRKSNAAEHVVAKQTAMEALDYLQSDKINKDLHPDLIFLDINMPGMNGWEFLETYNKMEAKYKSRAVVIMLTTSDNPDDKMKAKALNLASDFKTKPLSEEMLAEIMDKYFSMQGKDNDELDRNAMIN